MRDYTQTPTKLRIVQDAGMTDVAPDGEPDLVWQLDAIDTRTAHTDPATGLTCYAYTEQVWNFATHAEAVAAIPDFIGQLSEYLPDVRASIALDAIATAARTA